MCMERDINGLNYEKEEPDVQIAHAIHCLRVAVARSGKMEFMRKSQRHLKKQGKQS